jgi:hypothetical protein
MASFYPHYFREDPDFDPCPQEGLSDSLAADGRRSRDFSLTLPIGDAVAVQARGTS